VTVLGPCEIGENSVFAAGSLVLSDVKPNCVYAGSPEKFIKAMILMMNNEPASAIGSYLVGL
jgi:acetyltransferase-like isoleucine patch superfamily enzyme